MTTEQLYAQALASQNCPPEPCPAPATGSPCIQVPQMPAFLKGDKGDPGENTSLIADTAALALYTGPKSRLILEDGRTFLSATSSKTVDGIMVVTDARNTGKRWIAQFTGPLQASWFGVKADGAQNDVPYIQAALNFAEAEGIAQVQMPHGVSLLSGMTSVIVPAGVILLGGDTPPDKNVLTARFQFNITIGDTGNPSTRSESLPAFIVNPASGIHGYSFYYPNQPKTASVPTAYGWTIRTSGTIDGQDRVSLKNLLFINAYEAIRLDWGSQHMLDTIYGHPIKTGILIDRAYDVMHMRSVHFWPFFAVPGDALLGWIQQNGCALDIRHIDGLIGYDILVYGYNIGLHLQAGVDGLPWVMFTDVLLDVCNTPLLIDHLYRGTFTNLTTTGVTVSTSQDGILINPTVNSLDTDLLINGYSCANCTNGIRNKGVLRAVITGQSRIYQTNLNNGVRWFEVCNENTAALITYITSMSGDQYRRISGRVNINGGENFQSMTDITPSGFGTPHTWTRTDGTGTATAISGGSRVDVGVPVGGAEGSAITVFSFPLPAQVVSEHGLFMLSLRLKANQSSGLNTTRFYMRIRDYSLLPNIDYNLFPTANDAYMNDASVLQIPFLFSGLGGYIDLVFGYNITQNTITFDMTDVKLWKLKGYSSSFIERMPKHQGYSGRLLPVPGDPTYPLSTPLELLVQGDRATSRAKYITNINTDLPSGFYSVFGSTDVPNGNPASAWYLTVNRHQNLDVVAPNYRWDIALRIGYGEMYEREVVAGTYGPWYRVHSNRWLPVDETMTLTAGDLLFYNGSKLTRLPKGTTGQILTQGTTGPVWSNPSA